MILKRLVILNEKIKIIKINKLKEKEDFLNLLYKIYKKGKRRILIESGLSFINLFIKFRFIHNLYVFKSSKNLNIYGSNNSSPKLIKKFRTLDKLKVNLGDDQLFKVRLNNV